jgi:hypothetical protein
MVQNHILPILDGIMARVLQIVENERIAGIAPARFAIAVTESSFKRSIRSGAKSFAELGRRRSQFNEQRLSKCSIDQRGRQSRSLYWQFPDCTSTFVDLTEYYLEKQHPQSATALCKFNGIWSALQELQQTQDSHEMNMYVKRPVPAGSDRKENLFIFRVNQCKSLNPVDE